MKTIGVRDLRQRASEVLRLAERGESFQVTDRGRPVALITPLQAVTPLEQMRAVGDVSTPVSSIDTLPEPIALPSDAVAPSLVLAALRANER